MNLGPICSGPVGSQIQVSVVAYSLQENKKGRINAIVARQWYAITKYLLQAAGIQILCSHKTIL
jgi:hypothetical protein